MILRLDIFKRPRPVSFHPGFVQLCLVGSICGGVRFGTRWPRSGFGLDLYGAGFVVEEARHSRMCVGQGQVTGESLLVSFRRTSFAMCLWTRQVGHKEDDIVLII